ncbi:MAG: hypothetical protein OHK0029_31910 [Armatimonadaceae bacterium]
MNKMRLPQLLPGGIALASLILLPFATPASAQVTEIVEAFNNATVQPGGPRSGGSGKNFFNIEGNGLGIFASFGVADFDVDDFNFGFTVADVTAISIDFANAPAGFSADGPIGFYLASATGVSIEPDNTNLTYQSGNNGAASVDSDLGDLFFLGTATYTNDGTAGTVFSYVLNPTAAAETYLISQLNTPDAVLRLVVTPESDTVAATYAGFSNNTNAGPTFIITAVGAGNGAAAPEPGTLALIGLGLVVFRRFRSRKP